jgi:capsular polysaccharide transport system ATP-binding protein
MSIELVNLSKSFGAGKRRKILADQLNAVFPANRSIALLGRNGAGKSTLLRMIAGTVNPDRGYVRRCGTISWPVGFSGSFHGDLTGAQNTRFLARVYGVETDELMEFVRGFAELGHHYHQPFKTYSSGMRSRLAFGVSMGLHFDTYLIDEVTSVGDAAFRQKSTELLLERLENSGAIVVSHGMGMIRRLCDMAVVLENGALTFYEDVEEAIALHKARLLGE